MKYTRLFLLALIVCVAMPHVYSQKYKWTKYYMEVGALGGGSFIEIIRDIKKKKKRSYSIRLWLPEEHF